MISWFQFSGLVNVGHPADVDHGGSDLSWSRYNIDV